MPNQSKIRIDASIDVRTRWRLCLAVSALGVGFVCYSLFRGADSSVIARLIPDFSGASSALPLALTGSVPSFVHCFALAIVTACVVSRPLAPFAVAMWVLIDTASEFAQLNGGIFGFTLNGTYDPLDLVAIGLAAGCAWCLVLHRLPTEIRKRRVYR